jgi:ABC-type nitrate/sulfonate/bicarbonate transport system ATPase subunit
MQASGLKIEGLQIHYDKKLIVDDFDLSVGNESVVLFGPSGCGKTTILKAILGSTEQKLKVRGSILLDGERILPNQGDVGMVFQGPVLPPWMTVTDLCRMGCNMQKLSRSDQKQKIQDVLEKFGVGKVATSYPYNLSGGQKQRVALAVTLLNEPKVLLLDEPTTFLDGMSKIEVWNFIEDKIRPSGIPTIIVSHDPIEALLLGDRVYVLSEFAHIVREVEVPFSHPRHETMAQEKAFWEIRHKLVYG